MKKLLFLLLFPMLCRAQSETSNYITYDTLITVQVGPWTSAQFWCQITRNKYYFTTDTASRVLMLAADGDGEQGTDTTKLHAYGPQYWMLHGFGGGVQLGNGTHYPIWIKVQPTALNSVDGGIFTEPLLKMLIAEFHPRSVHTAGLSHGATLWGDLIAYASVAGDTYPMQHIKSWVAMQSGGGGADGNQSAFNALFPQCFKNWAKMGGRFFGIEGTNDYRQTWVIAQAMDSVVPGSAYEVLENDGGGAHCCWNDFYNPATQWQNVKAPYGNPWIVASPYNNPGDYIGGNIYQWMMCQGDTTLVGSVIVTLPPPAPSAGYFQFLPTSDQRIHTSDSVQLFATLVTDNQVDTIIWTETSGPTVADFPSFARYGSAAYSAFWLSNLAPGTYVFRASGKSSTGGAGSVTEMLTVLPAVTCPVCPSPRLVFSITIPVAGMTVTIPATGLPAGAIKFNDGSSQ